LGWAADFLWIFAGTLWGVVCLIVEKEAVSEVVNISIDDTELVQLVQQGDSAAMERLILRYQNRIYNAILKICANPDDAAELTQDTFVKILENIGGFQGRSSFYTWAFRIAVNLTLNYCKRNIRLGFRSLDEEAGRDSQYAKQMLKQFLSDESSPDPAAAAINKELFQMAVKALMMLSDEHRTIVVLRDIEEMNYSQIAEVIDIELCTV